MNIQRRRFLTDKLKPLILEDTIYYVDIRFKGPRNEFIDLINNYIPSTQPGFIDNYWSINPSTPIFIENLPTSNDLLTELVIQTPHQWSTSFYEFLQIAGTDGTCIAVDRVGAFYHNRNKFEFNVPFNNNIYIAFNNNDLFINAMQGTYIGEIQIDYYVRNLIGYMRDVALSNMGILFYRVSSNGSSHNISDTYKKLETIFDL